MSLYVFSCLGTLGTPQGELLSLLKNRIGYAKIFCSPENSHSAAYLSENIGVGREELPLLSLKNLSETDREYLMRVKKEGLRLTSLENNNVLLLPPENVRILCGLKEDPPLGYSEVL